MPAIDKAVLDAVGRGDTVLVIGAGFSLAPDENETRRDRKGLKETLVDQFKGTLNSSPHDIDSMSMEDVVFYLQSRGVSRGDIAAELGSFLATSSELARIKAFTQLRTLLTLRPGLFEAIVTTNWDKGIEESLRGVPGTTVSPLVTDKDFLRYNPTYLSVLKIHGDVAEPDSIVLSSLDFDIYEKTHPRIVERLRILLSTKHVLIIGYSLKDDNFRRIYRWLQHDLGDELRGGWIVAPDLADREKLWAPSAHLKHIAANAEEFLGAVLSNVAMIPIGTASGGLPSSATPQKFEKRADLNEQAGKLREAYGLRDVWVTSVRTGERPNKSMGVVAAAYIETECRDATSLAISTGETMEALATSLDTDVFTNTISVSPTTILLAGQRGFKDPSHVAQVLLSRFKPNRAMGLALRLPDEEYLAAIMPDVDAQARAELFRAVGEIAKAQIQRAVQSDVVVASVRPPDWFGGGEMPDERTLPIQWIPGADPKETYEAMHAAGVVAIHQLIPLDEGGNDVTGPCIDQPVFQKLSSLTERPTTTQLASAASGAGKVITVACKREKAESVRALLTGKLCNVLVVDDGLALALLESPPGRPRKADSS